MKGFIKLGSKTEKHAATLKEKGFKCEVVGENLEIECSGFQYDPIDLQANPNGLVELVKAQNLLTYKTRVTCPDGVTRFGVPLCIFLGAASCLVAKDKPKKEPKVNAAVAF